MYLTLSDGRRFLVPASIVTVNQMREWLRRVVFRRVA